jgi:hypothetical protein
MVNIIKVQKVPQKTQSAESIIARFCCYFPQYKFHEARKLPFFRLKMMINIWEKEYARRMIDLVEIVSAPHTKKGSGVRKVIDKYKKIIEE